jgi:hypothetical protein
MVGGDVGTPVGFVHGREAIKRWFGNLLSKLSNTPKKMVGWHVSRLGLIKMCLLICGVVMVGFVKLKRLLKGSKIKLGVARSPVLLWLNYRQRLDNS